MRDPAELLADIAELTVDLLATRRRIEVLERENQELRDIANQAREALVAKQDELNALKSNPRPALDYFVIPEKDQ